MRGSEVSLCRLRKDYLVQRQVRKSAPKPRVLGLEILQPLDLVALQAPELLTQ